MKVKLLFTQLTQKLTQSGAMGNVKVATKEKGDCLLASIFDDQEGLIKDIQSKILTNSVNQN